LDRQLHAPLGTIISKVKAGVTTMRCARPLALIGIVTIIITILTGFSASAEQDALVLMTEQMRFTPANLTVQIGDTVEWRNTSGMAHTVSADPQLAVQPNHVALPAGAMPFNSGELPPQGRFRHTFDIPGVYRYVCIHHGSAGMVGTVVVKRNAEESLSRLARAYDAAMHPER
jgi:plastocyanin